MHREKLFPCRPTRIRDHVLAGVYGTNFKYLPELEYRYGYFIFWGTMIFIAVTMLGVFQRKQWL